MTLNIEIYQSPRIHFGAYIRCEHADDGRSRHEAGTELFRASYKLSYRSVMRHDPDEQREIEDFIASVPDEFRDKGSEGGETDAPESFGFKVRGLWGLFFAFLFGIVFGLSFMAIGAPRSSAATATSVVAGIAFLFGFLLPGRIMKKPGLPPIPFI